MLFDLLDQIGAKFLCFDDHRQVTFILSNIIHTLVHLNTLILIVMWYSDLFIFVFLVQFLKFLFDDLLLLLEIWTITINHIL